MPPEDLSREIERLWTRLGTVSDLASPPPVAPQAAGAELVWETVAMLKTQHRRREAALNEAIAAKEESLKLWRARAEAIQGETAELRARVDANDGLVYAQHLDARQRLEGAARAIEQEREARRALEAALDESRERIAAEVARAREAEALWAKRETQNLIDLKDIQSSAERRLQEAAQADQAVSALKGSLAEAKNALEKTLAELLLERHERVRVEEERARALKKTDEVEAHFKDLQRLWEEERAQWRELWDRERSTWEAQRQEFAQWEETLRREREAWHGELQEKEKSHLIFTDSLADKLRETTAAASLVAERMRRSRIGRSATRPFRPRRTSRRDARRRCEGGGCGPPRWRPPARSSSRSPFPPGVGQRNGAMSPRRRSLSRCPMRPRLRSTEPCCGSRTGGDASARLIPSTHVASSRKSPCPPAEYSVRRRWRSATAVCGRSTPRAPR